MLRKVLLALGVIVLVGCGSKEIPDKQRESTKKTSTKNTRNDGNTTDHLPIATITIRTEAEVNPMHRIAQEGDIQAAQEYIDNGGDVRVAAPSGNTFLHEAARNGHFDMVRLLVENGADVNAIARQADDVWWTPLGIAVYINHYDMATFLIEKGADANFKHSTGESFLHKVAWGGGDIKMARILIEEGGIDINIEDRRGLTALRIGVQKGHLEFAKSILDTNKVDENIVSNALSLLLLLAKQNGDKDMIQFLSKKEQASKNTGVIVVSNFSEHPMFEIILANDIQAVQEYIDNGGNIRVANLDGYTFLHEMVRNGNLEMAQLLVENGAYINAIARQANDVLWTPLGIAVYINHYDMAAFLVGNGADANFKEHYNNGENFLHKVAWRSGDVKMARILIEEGGIDIHSKDHRGVTALRIGIQEGYLNFVRLIFDSMDGNGGSYGFSRFLPLAEQMGHEDVFNFLFERALQQKLKMFPNEEIDQYKPVRPYDVYISLWHIHNMAWEIYKKMVPSKKIKNSYKPVNPYGANSKWRIHNMIWEVYREILPEEKIKSEYKPIKSDNNDSIWRILDMVWELYRKIVLLEETESDHKHPYKSVVTDLATGREIRLSTGTEIWDIHNMVWELHNNK